MIILTKIMFPLLYHDTLSSIFKIIINIDVFNRIELAISFI